jgi:hypothetical protein
VLWRDTGQRLGMTDRASPPVSIGIGVEVVPIRVGAQVGCGSFWLLGQNGTPGPFLIFQIFCFLFPFY